MGSGLLYGGIGVLWIAMLSRTWLNRRITARAERDAPASSRQRILDPTVRRSGPRRHGAGDVRRVVAVQDVSRRSGRGGGWPISRGARRRRRILLLLLVIAVALGAGFGLHRLPWWAPTAGLAAAATWFALGLFAARAGRRARRGHRRRVARRERTERDRLAGRIGDEGVPADRVEVLDEPSWGSVASVGIVARWGREDSDTDGLDRRLVRSFVGREPAVAAADATGIGPVPSGAAGAGDALGGAAVPSPARGEQADLTSGAAGVAMQRAVAVEIAPGSWQPVPVPLPTYVTAPLAPRTVASIPLGVAGSWTSASSPSGEQTAQILLGNPSRNPRPQVEVGGAAVASAQVGAPSPRHASPATEDDLTSEVDLDLELPEAVGN